MAEEVFFLGHVEVASGMDGEEGEGWGTYVSRIVFFLLGCEASEDRLRRFWGGL